MTWLDQSSNEQGFRIEAAERRRPFKPVATAAPNATAVVVPDLKADTPYTFRVSALGNAGSKSAAAVTSGEPLTLELMSGEDPLEAPGWFRFSLAGSSAPTRGEAAFDATGALQPGTGWYYGSNWREAALKQGAITGTITVTDPSTTNAPHNWEFAAGPFRVGTGEQLKAQVEAEAGATYDLPADNTKLVVLDDQWSDPDRDYDDFYWGLNVVGPVTFKLQLVNFGARESNQFFPIQKDDGSGAYSGNAWEDKSSPLDNDADDEGDHKHPLAYHRNATMKVDPRFVFSLPEGQDPANGPTLSEIEIVGTGPGNISFYAKDGDPNSSVEMSGNAIIGHDEASNAFANTIDYFDTFDIDWTISLSGDAHSVAISKNKVYVTLETPTASPLFHTLLEIGCKNAKGQTDSSVATGKIWDEFTNRVVKRVDGTQMTYYADYLTTNITTASLLANGDGQCGAWAKFFADTIKAQGIVYQGNFVEVTSSIAHENFLVNNWTFDAGGGGGHTNNPDYPYLNLVHRVSANSVADSTSETSYNWRYAEVTDAAGTPAQGNANPASLFSAHYLVKINGEYYDPTSGLKYADLAAFESAAVAGYYVAEGMTWDETTINADLDGDGNMTDPSVDVWAYAFRQNPVGNQLQETVITY